MLGIDVGAPDGRGSLPLYSRYSEGDFSEVPLGASVTGEWADAATERMYSDVSAPSALYMTINPQYTIMKARELYGGEPRPLSARHEFIRQTFLSDTEDWRSHAHIGSKKGAVASINVVAPEQSTYLAASAKRKMSYYRQKSLSRAVSYRAVLVKRSGELAANQYSDQYYDKAEVQRTLKASMSVKGAADPDAEESVRKELSRSLSKAPDRKLTASLSKVVRPSTADATTLRSLSVRKSGVSFGGADLLLDVPKSSDLGMGRAMSRIMSRSRSQNLRKSGTGASVKFMDSDDIGRDVFGDNEPGPGPTFEDL